MPAIEESLKRQDEYQPGKAAQSNGSSWPRNGSLPGLSSNSGPLRDHKAKRVRDAVARAIGKIGEAIVPRSIPLLSDKKKERRSLGRDRSFHRGHSSRA